MCMVQDMLGLGVQQAGGGVVQDMVGLVIHQDGSAHGRGYGGRTRPSVR